MSDHIAGLVRALDRGMRYVGFGLMILGGVAVVAPLLTGLAVAVAIGVVLLLAGGLLAVLGMRARASGKGNVVLVLAGLAGLAGLVLLFQPSAGLAVVRWILIPYFLISGISEAMLALRVRPEEGWSETLGGAVVSFVAGLALWFDWPISGVRAVGLLVGGKLIASGWSVVRVHRTLVRAGEALGSAAERLRSRAIRPPG